MKTIKENVMESIVLLLATYMAENGREDKTIEIREGNRTYVLMVTGGSGDVLMMDTDGDILIKIKSGHCNNCVKAFKVITDYIKMENDDK